MSGPFIGESTYRSIFTPVNPNELRAQILHQRSAAQNRSAAQDSNLITSMKRNFKSLYSEQFTNPPEKIYVDVGSSN